MDQNPYKSSYLPEDDQETAELPEVVLDLGRLMMFAPLMILSFRFMAIPLILWLSVRSEHRIFRRSQVLAVCLLVLALLSPVDVGMPILGSVMGETQPGIRVVPVIVGMPAHTYLVSRYGEYVTVGCCGLPCAYQPKYWIVWWW